MAIDLHDPRLAPLANELHVAVGQCPFVIDGSAAQQIQLAHYSGGRDATYVCVSRESAAREAQEAPISVEIRYATFIEGTTLIYDATAETLQGKARPFVCHLGQETVRVYAVMPFQIEAIDVRLETSGAGPALRVAFRDARGQIIQAALPFELQTVDSAGSVAKQYASTDRLGRFTCSLPSANIAKVVVRSLLTGIDESLVLAND
jgi:hypothetical protein